MKTLISSLIIPLVALTGFGCTKSGDSRRGTDYTAHWLDLNIDGQRYYGLIQERTTITGDEEETEYSCVLLLPWDKRPSTAVKIEDGVSTITLGEAEYKIIGRRVCTTTSFGESLTVLPDDIPFAAFESRETLEQTVAKIIKKKHNKSEQATPRKPSD